MANTYYESELTDEQVEAALEAIDGVISAANNGKVLAISGGKIVARSVQSGGAVLESLSVTENGDYAPSAGVDGYSTVHVAIPEVTVDEALDPESENPVQNKVVTDAIYNLHPTDTASGAIASFPDGAEDIPLKELTVQIEPYQSGTGDPSPSNVRPISGWTGCNVYDDPAYGGTVAWNQLVQNGNFSDGNRRWSTNRISEFSVNDGVASFTPNAQYGGIAQDLYNKPFQANHVVMAIAQIKTDVALNYVQLGLSDNVIFTRSKVIGTTAGVWSEVGLVIKETTVSTASNHTYFARQSTAAGFEKIYIRNVMCFDLTAMFGSTIADFIYTLEQSTPGAGVAWFRELFPNDYYEYNPGEETTVSAVNGDEYRHVEIDWTDEAGTVYGGKLDVTNGTLTVTHGNISSYAGETLSGEWISSMDVYTAGGTPTTGAQVVYELATPFTVQLTPQQISTLEGTNNIWADAGDVDVTYRANTKLYIDKKIAELQALVLENGGLS